MSYGLVFAGGGAKGAYEIGVWKALAEIGVKIDAVTGVSIGSINGALFVQDSLELAEHIWMSIGLDNIVALEGAKSQNLFSMENIFGIIEDVYKNQGLDMSPLQNILSSIIDEKKIRNSGLDYGLATFSLTDRKNEEVFISDIPEGHLVEYLMASACLPGFQTRKINDKEFIDGGVGNNMPVSMLIDKGYKDIITVDVGGIGVVKSIDETGLNRINIKCDDKIIGTMEFKPESIEKSIKKGYYDTYKAFGRLCGNIYYFNTMSYYHAKMKYSDNIMLSIEYAGEIFGIEKFAAYNIDKFIAGVISAYHAADNKYREMRSILTEQNIFDLFGKTSINGAVLTAWLVDVIRSGNREFMSNKLIMNLAGNSILAANAIIYLTE